MSSIKMKDGSINETIILNTLNNHKYKDLSPKWKRHMKRMFKSIQDDDVIKVRYHEFKDAKPDLDITVNGRTLRLSIKSGHAPQVHQEPIYTFYKYLRDLTVPGHILSKMYFYHYGHGHYPSKDGKIYTREEIVEKFPKLIEEVNEYFASHDEVVSQIIYRCIIKGRLERDLIDYFYYGNAAKGFLLSVSDVQKLIISNKNKFNVTICMDELTYVAGSRKQDGPKLHSVKIHWPILCKYFYNEEFMKKYG